MLQMRYPRLTHPLAGPESVLNSTAPLSAVPTSSHNSDPVAQTK